jgi:ABC-type transporter Mla subunit MlaD
MAENQRYVRLGVFVFVTLVVVAAILFILGGRSLLEPTFTFETYFDESVAGLDVGAPVKFRGVPMGQVTQIVTSPAVYEVGVPIAKRREYIVVRVKITGHKAQVLQWKAEAQEMVKDGLRVQTQLAGITGEQYLALDRLDPKTHPPLPFDWTPEYLYIPSAPSFAGEITANVQKFLAQLNGADIKELGQNLNKLTVSLTRKVDELPVAELSAEASALLKDSRATVDRLKVVLDKPAVDAMLEDTSAFTGRLRKIADSGEFDRMVQSIDDLAQRLDGVVGDNQYDVRVIVQDLRVTADNLRTLSETLKRYPAGVLTGGPPEKLQIPEKSP